MKTSRDSVCPSPIRNAKPRPTIKLEKCGRFYYSNIYNKYTPQVMNGCTPTTIDQRADIRILTAHTEATAKIQTSSAEIIMNGVEIYQHQ